MDRCGAATVRRRRGAGPIIPLVAVSLALAGCAGGVSRMAAPPLADSAVQPVGLTTDDASDWAAAARVLPDAFDALDGNVAWYNPVTGTSGTLGPTGAADAAGCRPFATTMSDWRGVRRYLGEACRSGEGAWAIVSTAAEDSTAI